MKLYKSQKEIAAFLFPKRRHGDSKMSTGIIKEALWILWKMRIRK